MNARHVDARVIDTDDGRRLGYREFGASEGRPVVYCHGMPGSSLESRLLADAAKALNVRIVALDRPGYASTSPRGPRMLGDEVHDVQKLVDTLELHTFGVFGFSGGGPHAMAIAALLPGRVDHLTLVSSWAPFDAAGLDGMDEGFRRLWNLARNDFGAFRIALRQALDDAGDAYTLLFAGAPEADRAILSEAFVHDAYRKSTQEATRSGLEGMFEDAHALSGQWPFRMDAITCPVHVWHGERDGNAPVAMGRWLAEHLPDGRYTEWPDATHFEWLRRREAVLLPHSADR